MKNYNYISILLMTVFITNMYSQNSIPENTTLISNELISLTPINTEAKDTIKSVTSYYFFPNMLVYFDIEKKIYHYQLDKNWVTSEELPLYYGGYSLFKNERVIVTIPSNDEPQKHIKEHRKEFPINPKGRIERPALSMVGNNATALN